VAGAAYYRHRTQRCSRDATIERSSSDTYELMVSHDIKLETQSVSRSDDNHVEENMAHPDVIVLTHPQPMHYTAGEDPS
jgi:hypothetical protein